MTHDLSARIEYSEKYVDDTHEYRCVLSTFIFALRAWEVCVFIQKDGDYSSILGSTNARNGVLARHVILPKEMQRSLPDRLLTETEWRQLGVQQSRGWVHYAIHKPEPHILLFRRPLGTDPTTGRVNPTMEKEAKDKYAKDFN
ncbi:hypothetical protein BBJ28_00016047 [Nothophytophthora sp. Chile5]|nr:hypothetical protein BBJ28_00016047 [Nothophytophthora sp. Chile5]